MRKDIQRKEQQGAKRRHPRKNDRISRRKGSYLEYDPFLRKEALDTENALGAKLQELRKKYGYTQADIAALLGVDQGTVSAYESGERKASADTLEKLGDLYCCDLLHTPPVASPEIRAAFHTSGINVEKVKAIRAVNRVFLNSVFMAGLLEEKTPKIPARIERI